MSTVNVKFVDFTFDSIKEEYSEGFSFGSTFNGDDMTELTNVIVGLTKDDGSTYEIAIRPYRSQGYYGGYSDTGKGLSSQILVDLIDLLQNSETITFDQFMNRLINTYASSYKVQLTVNGQVYVPLNTILYISHLDDLNTIKNIDDAVVVDVDKLSVEFDDNEKIKSIQYVDDNELSQVLTDIVLSQPDLFVERYYRTSVHYDMILLALFRHTEYMRYRNLIVIDTSRKLRKRELNINDDVYDTSFPTHDKLIYSLNL